jgi:hypothetical protein
MTVSRWTLLKVKNILDNLSRKNQNTYFMFSTFFFPRKSCVLLESVEKIGQSQTDHRWKYNTTHALCVLDNESYKHTLRICNIFSSSTATAVTRKHAIVKVHVLFLLFELILRKAAWEACRYKFRHNASLHTQHSAKILILFVLLLIHNSSLFITFPSSLPSVLLCCQQTLIRRTKEHFVRTFRTGNFSLFPPTTPLPLPGRVFWSRCSKWLLALSCPSLHLFQFFFEVLSWKFKFH